MLGALILFCKWFFVAVDVFKMIITVCITSTTTDLKSTIALLVWLPKFDVGVVGKQ